MRKYLIAGNWKMHGQTGQVHELLSSIKKGAHAYSAIDVLVCPPFVYLNEAHGLLAHTPLLLGAQNLYLGEQGAFTGEVSGAMLADVGCQYVLVGHSERRTLFHEPLSLVAEKCKAALAAQLTPILCIGETNEERLAGKTQAIIRTQLEPVIELIGIEAFYHLVIAYEPVWAIGTGLTATPHQAQETHAFIRELIAKNNVDIAQTIRILYGGSMKADNASSLLAMPDIDGGLIGGASLNAESFLAICAIANEATATTKMTMSK